LEDLAVEDIDLDLNGSSGTFLILTLHQEVVLLQEEHGHLLTVGHFDERNKLFLHRIYTAHFNLLLLKVSNRRDLVRAIVIIFWFGWLDD
jgi:hypothetical protein